MLFNKGKNKAQTSEAKNTPMNIPDHIAIIMDGNGRWAERQHRPRIFGHEAGMQNVKKITLAANEMGVKVLTLFAFSTENWSRPQKEVSFLMKLPIDFFDVFVPELMANNVRVETIGDISQLPEKTRQVVEHAVAETAENTGMILNFALNYGGRQEIVQAIRQIAQSAIDQQTTIEEIDEQTVNAALSTAQLGQYAEPELVIRTSGELRLSNLLPWQTVYSELYFTDRLWPDFTAEDLKKAVTSYTQRDRRFGGLKEG